MHDLDSLESYPPRIPGTLLNRADLLLAWAACPPADRQTVAADCGFKRADARRPKPEPPLPVAPLPPLPEIEPRPAIDAPPAKLRFLQPVSYARIEGAEGEPHRPPEVGDEPIAPEKLDARRYRIRPEPLQRWSRLWPFLHHVLGHYLPGNRIDVKRLVSDLARQRPVLKLPYQLRLAWTPQIHLLIDAAPAMKQFRGDVDVLLERLKRMRGSEGFFCDTVDVLLDEPKFHSPSEPSATPTAGESVLVLSDLGCLNQDDGRMNAWLRYGRLLQRRGVHRFALLPCPRDRWDAELARVWRCAPWDRHDRPAHGRRGRRPLPASDDPTRQQQMLAALLGACSFALRIEAPLLRELRLLLPAADAASEHDLRSHPAVVTASSLCAVRPEQMKQWQRQFAAADDEFTTRLKDHLYELLSRHHQVHGTRLLDAELLNLAAAGIKVDKQRLAAAKENSRACLGWRVDEIETAPGDGEPPDALGLAAFTERELARVSDERAATDAELAAAAAWEDAARGDVAKPPANINREVYDKHFDFAVRKNRRQQVWQLRQRGDNFELFPPHEQRPAGTPLGLVPMLSPLLDLELHDKDRQRQRKMRTDREQGRSCEAGGALKIEAASDRCHFELEATEVPPWATRFGWDRHGLFADFVAGGVTFALRWIPPGEFEMGSPEDEPGRFDWEGPRHRVTIPRGFWMGATPVTQGQYAAVTDERPAHLVHAGNDAPVENVNWDDCQQFCAALAKTAPQLASDLQIRLPSEAEWEYACRAGTDTALYTGPLTIKGERNGPELNEIAWYGGNSGVEYDGAYDSSDWREKQIEHNRAGTHPVAQKAANAWGLFDMLGNVWEWCEDPWHGDYDDAPVDGSAWGTEGSYRVYRGGSWAYGARDCRCAYRRYWLPDDRSNDVGFRLVLSRSSTGAYVRSS